MDFQVCDKKNSKFSKLTFLKMILPAYFFIGDAYKLSKQFLSTYGQTINQYHKKDSSNCFPPKFINYDFKSEWKTSTIPVTTTIHSELSYVHFCRCTNHYKTQCALRYTCSHFHEDGHNFISCPSISIRNQMDTFNNLPSTIKDNLEILIPRKTTPNWLYYLKITKDNKRAMLLP